jgi:hypothetical protein
MNRAVQPNNVNLNTKLLGKFSPGLGFVERHRRRRRRSTSTVSKRRVVTAKGCASNYIQLTFFLPRVCQLAASGL